MKKLIAVIRQAVNLPQLYLMGLGLLPSVASASGDTDVGSVLEHLLNYITSTPAKMIALLAIVGVGYATLHLGKMPKSQAMAVVIGIGIIYGGASIMSKLTGM